MTGSIQLLKQISKAAKRIADETDNPEHCALPAGADAALNELILSGQPEFKR